MYREISTIERDYQHAVVRDLAWAIASPPLMQPAGGACHWFSDEWYLQRYSSAQEWLKKLDQDPTSLVEQLQAQKDRRLGNYFETLLAYWLSADPQYDLIERNLPIRDAGNTLGELDFIVRDKHSGQNYHWEVAVKFYLGVGDTRQRNNWHGPGKRDRLDIKLDHLQNRQSQICSLLQTQKVLQQRNIDIAGSAVILKGRLFYPYPNDGVHPAGANRHHLRSHWYRLKDLVASAAQEDRFRPLLNSGWMADHGSVNAADYKMAELLSEIQQKKLRLPLYLISIRRHEIHRLFLVPDDWDSQLSE
jgi:hypothetical protein